MDWKVFIAVFGSVFMAELGDKTQLATLLFATDKECPKWIVFLASAAALVAASALAVTVGKIIGDKLDPKTISWIAGACFIAIGVWTILKA